MIRAIETRYKGYRFRSRLEARWAVYFDALGIKWEYEKEGYDLGGIYYLPDFWLPQVEMWAEVKAEEFTAEEEEKAVRLVELTGYQVLKLIGAPDYRAYFTADTDPDYGNQEYLITNLKLDEGRFFGSPCFDKGVMNESEKMYWSDVARGVNAARSARFEFGENGS